MNRIQDLRGYPSGRYAPEAKAAKTMLNQGYSPDEIAECYQESKKDPFWEPKALSLMSLAGLIGEWQAQHSKLQPKAVCERCNGSNYYRLDDQPLFCDHSGEIRAPDPWVDLTDTWEAALDILKADLPRPTYETWLAKSKFLALDAGRFMVTVKDAFDVEWLERRIFHSAQKNLNQVMANREPADLVFVVDDADDS